MATRTFTSAGVNNLWSNAANWLVAAPVDTDAFLIPNGQTCEFDADLSLWAGLAASTIAAGGTLKACETASAYVLKMTGDLTVNGTLQAGTSVAVPYPSTCTFTINFSGVAKSIEVSATGHVYLYCTQPTNKYVTITEALDAVETEFDIDTDLTADGPWSISGAQVRIVDSTPLDSEIRTIAVGGVAVAGHIDVTAALTNTKTTNSMMLLVTRNIRIINVAASDYAITYAAGAGSGDYIGAEINNCYRGITGGSEFEFAGFLELLTTSPRGISGSTKVTYSGITGGGSGSGFTFLYGVTDCSATSSSVIAGWSSALSNGSANTGSGLIFGCTAGAYIEPNFSLTATGIIHRCSYGLQSVVSSIVYGNILSCGRAIFEGGNILVANCTLEGTSVGELVTVAGGRLHNVLFAGIVTEFSGYSSGRGKNDYVESFNHDQVENAFKAWCRGGIVTHSFTNPPDPYTIWYQHACESASYPCFRQYETTVPAGTAIEVAGKIRIYAGDDHTAFPPALQIIDKFADPLVDSTQTPLDECEIPEPDGDVEDDWQDVSVIWANQGDAPRQVIVRIIAQHATADVDEVWAVADYQDQISTLYNTLIPIKTTVATANTTTSFTLTAGQATADCYNNMTLMVQDDTDGHWELRSITDWTAGRVITVDTAFGFTPAAGDLAYIMATSYGAPVDLAAITDKLPTNYIMGSSDQDNHDTDIDSILADTNEMQGKLPTNYIMGSSDQDDHDTDIDSILTDTNEMQGKLPTNNIMGSSDKSDKDDEIDAIKVETDKLPRRFGGWR